MPWAINTTPMNSRNDDGSIDELLRTYDPAYWRANEMVSHTQLLRTIWTIRWVRVSVTVTGVLAWGLSFVRVLWIASSPLTSPSERTMMVVMAAMGSMTLLLWTWSAALWLRRWRRERRDG